MRYEPKMTRLQYMCSQEGLQVFIVTVYSSIVTANGFSLKLIGKVYKVMRGVVRYMAVRHA